MMQIYLIFMSKVVLTSIINTKSNNTILTTLFAKITQKIDAEFGSEMIKPNDQWMCPPSTGFEAALINSLLLSPVESNLSTSVKWCRCLSFMIPKQTKTNLLPISSMTLLLQGLSFSNVVLVYVSTATNTTYTLPEFSSPHFLRSLESKTVRLTMLITLRCVQKGV